MAAPDEFVGLPAALYQAGAAGVIATRRHDRHRGRISAIPDGTELTWDPGTRQWRWASLKKNPAGNLRPGD